MLNKGAYAPFLCSKRAPLLPDSLIYRASDIQSILVSQVTASAVRFIRVVQQNRKSMRDTRRNKSGYTLVEVLVVVIIIGILSSMGVAGLQDAVANSRIKGAAVNTAAFLERVGNLSKQRSDIICLAIDQSDPQTLLALKSKGSDCSNDNKYDTEILDHVTIDAPAQFVTIQYPCNYVGDVDMTGSVNATFKPRLGLSAVPNGAVCIQYGSDLRFGLARKSSTINTVKAYWKIGNDNGASGWDEL